MKPVAVQNKAMEERYIELYEVWYPTTCEFWK